MTVKIDATRDDLMKSIKLFLLLIILIFLFLSLASCNIGKAPEPTPDINAIYTSAAGTALAQISNQMTQTAPVTIWYSPTLSPWDVGTPKPGFTPSATHLPTGDGALSVEKQMEQIDTILKQTLGASISYNKPESMNLDQTTTIELLLNPSISPQDLSTQISQPGQITSASIQITPRMKATLLANDETAFLIQSLHDNPEQLISATETTHWDWMVTAKKSGRQQLTLIIYQLVQYNGQDYWREVETYKADIDVNITIVQQVQGFDWKWIAGIVISLIGIPALWRYIDSRNKKGKKRVK